MVAIVNSAFAFSLGDLTSHMMVDQLGLDSKGAAPEVIVHRFGWESVLAGVPGLAYPLRHFLEYIIAFRH